MASRAGARHCGPRSQGDVLLSRSYEIETLIKVQLWDGRRLVGEDIYRWVPAHVNKMMTWAGPSLTFEASS
jgi:hypothetical protein